MNTIVPLHQDQQCKFTEVSHNRMLQTGFKGHIAKIIADFVKTCSSNSKVGEAVADSHKKVGAYEVVKIDKHTEAIFDFEVLKSVSCNESDHFAYKVSFNGKKDINHTNNIINTTNTTNTNLTNLTNLTNKTNTTNITRAVHKWTMKQMPHS